MTEQSGWKISTTFKNQTLLEKALERKHLLAPQRQCFVPLSTTIFQDLCAQYLRAGPGYTRGNPLATAELKPEQGKQVTLYFTSVHAITKLTSFFPNTHSQSWLIHCA